MTEGPLIVQSDKTLLLEVDHPDATACRMSIAPFAELERSPEHVHTYRLTPLGLWNARAAGHDAESVVDALLRFSRGARVSHRRATARRGAARRCAACALTGLDARAAAALVPAELFESGDLATSEGGNDASDQVKVATHDRVRSEHSPD